MPKAMMPIVILTIAIGCKNDSARVAELATQHAKQQNELSRETVELQAELVKGTQQLVQADAQSRRDFIELEAKLDEQRADIARNREELANEHRVLVARRVRDPVIANAVIAVGSLMACLLPLLVAGYLLRCHLNEPDDPATTELLLEEMVSRHAALTPAEHPAIDHRGNAPRIGSDADPRSPNDVD
jgi:hypothetical protein